MSCWILLCLLPYSISYQLLLILRALTPFSSFLLLNHGAQFIKHTLYFGILSIFFCQFLKTIRDQNDPGDVRLVLCTGRVYGQVGERGAIISIQWSARDIKQDDIESEWDNKLNDSRMDGVGGRERD